MGKDQDNLLYQRDLENRIELLEKQLREAYADHDQQIKKCTFVFHGIIRDSNDHLGKALNVIDYLGTYPDGLPLGELENYLNMIKKDLTSFRDKYTDKSFDHLREIMKK